MMIHLKRVKRKLNHKNRRILVQSKISLQQILPKNLRLSQMNQLLKNEVFVNWKFYILTIPFHLILIG